MDPSRRWRVGGRLADYIQQSLPERQTLAFSSGSIYHFFVSFLVCFTLSVRTECGQSRYTGLTSQGPLFFLEPVVWRWVPYSQVPYGGSLMP